MNKLKSHRSKTPKFRRLLEVLIDVKMVYKRILGCLFMISILTIPSRSQEISFITELNQMVKTDHFCKSKDLSTYQYSGFSREGNNPDNVDCLYKEGKWLVYADSKGPGVTTRIWSTVRPNRGWGNMKLELDGKVIYKGETKYFFEMGMPFANPISKIEVRGKNQVQDTNMSMEMKLRTEELKNLKWGLFICWSFSTFSGQEWTPTEGKDASYFKATGCDTDQWCKVARDAGMGYILFLTKHHDGFCLWDTKTTEKKVTNSPLGIDVLNKLHESCNKYGIKLALYFSEGDWTFPGASFSKSGGTNPEIKKAQLKELLTNYGPIDFIWFDHAQGDGGLSHNETDKWIAQFQPYCLVGYNHGTPAGHIRLGELGKPSALDDISGAGYNKNAGGYKGYIFAEFTYPILPPHKGGAMWFYSLPIHDNLCLPAEKIYFDYLQAVKYGNIFSLNLGPDYAGRIRRIDHKTLKKVGKYIRTDYELPKNWSDKLIDQYKIK